MRVFATGYRQILNAKTSIPPAPENKIFSSFKRELFILAVNQHVYKVVFISNEIFGFKKSLSGLQKFSYSGCVSRDRGRSRYRFWLLSPFITLGTVFFLYPEQPTKAPGLSASVGV